MKLRGRLLRALRESLWRQGFVEVETPVRVKTPALEEHINALPTGPAYLRTSPELHMKRLVQAGMDRIFQIGPCFREDEHGRLHREEFTMLEWYWAGADYQQLLEQTEEMLHAAVVAAAGGPELAYQGREASLEPPWTRLTVDEAFARFAGMEPEQALQEDRFDMALVDLVEPHLGIGKPCFLTDWPAALGSLARARPNAPHLVERWELYIGGVELANAYGELTDAAEQRRRFARAAASRQANGAAAYALDEDFLAALEQGMPPTAGCALGIDRLAMLAAGAEEIAEVIAFPEEGETRRVTIIDTTL